MADKIFSLHPNGVLQPLLVAGFVNEDLLQALLATHPDLLAGEQVDPDAPRRW